MAANHLSRSAHDRLQAEFHDLSTRGRIEVANKIEVARLMGDLSENGDYHAAKDEQGHMEGRIRQLEYLLDPINHVIIEGDAEPGVISPGSIVTLVYEGDSDDLAEKYLIGHMEEKTAELDVMSPHSPLGSALLGHGAGDTVEYQAPHGVLKVKVLEVGTA
jgi:transcription elongation factor GreA